MISYFEFNTYFEFIVLKYSQIYYKYFQFNKFTELQYHGIENFVMVSKNDTAVLLNFGILQSPISRYTTAEPAKVLMLVFNNASYCYH